MPIISWNANCHSTHVGLRWAEGIPEATPKEVTQMLFLILLIILLIALMPTWPYSRGWGYYPSGGIGLILVILLVLLLLGYV